MLSWKWILHRTCKGGCANMLGTIQHRILKWSLNSRKKTQKTQVILLCHILLRLLHIHNFPNSQTFMGMGRGHLIWTMEVWTVHSSSKGEAGKFIIRLGPDFSIGMILHQMGSIYGYVDNTENGVGKILQHSPTTRWRCVIFGLPLEGLTEFSHYIQ